MRFLPKVLLGAWVIALLPLAGVGWVLTREMTQFSRRNALIVQESLARRTVDSVRLRMDRAVDLLTFMARMDDLAGPAAEQTLAAAMDSSPFFTDLWVYDLRGRAQAHFHRLGESPGVTPAEWPIVKKHINAQGSYGGPTYFVEGRSPRRTMAVLLAGGQGYLVGRMNLYLVSEDLAGLDVGRGGRIFILDGSNRLVAHSLTRNPEGFLAPVPARNGKASSEEYVAWDGVRALGVRLPIAGSDLTVLYETPAMAARETANRIQKRILSALVLGAFFAGILALVLGLLVSRSLKEVRDALAKMKEGRFDVLVAVRSRDEFGDLARTLGEAQISLEKRVRDSVLGRMARLIGHDMRQPVQAARTALDTALRHLTGVDDVGVVHLRHSFAALDEMDDYIEDILTVGRDRPPARNLLDLNELAQQVVRRVRVPETFTVETRWAKNLPHCPIDEREAARAFTNALKNAIEAAGPKGRVLVSSERLNDHTVVLEVQDNGPGLTPEKRAHLFEEFTTKEGGNGLGLLVMKKVMAQHQGKLEILDAPAHGVRVRFLFPLTPLPGPSNPVTQL
jgi:signal transduction histidine kinase